MDATCLHLLHSLVASNLGKEGVNLVVPNVRKAESEISKFLWEQRCNPSLTCCFIVGRKTWKTPWKWGQEQQEAFDNIKEALVSAPILTLPDVRRPFKVVCDACDYGVGAVLFQDGKVCAYFSKKLGASERNYSATERELLAVVYALTEWRCYLLGKPVTVVTDHKCNTFLGQQVGLSPRRARWAERLQEFEIEWVWEPGKTNIADPLSRCHFTQHPGPGGRDNGAAVAGAALRRKRRRTSPDSLTPSSRDVEGTLTAQVRKVPKVTLPGPAHETPSSLGTMEQIGLASPSELTRETDGYESLLGKLEKAYTYDPWLAARANRRKVSLKGGFWERNGRKYVPALFEERKDGELVVENLRRGILEALHDPPHVGHPGVTRMYELVTRELYWPGMYEDVKAYVAHCDSCQRVKARNTLPAGLLHPLQIPARKWQSVSMDFISNLPQTPSGNDAI
eukprot:jgi/Botrbrau1/15254/Bobra.0228s0007.1